MVFFSCTNLECCFVARVHGPDSKEIEHLLGPPSDWFPDKYPCPQCGSQCAVSTKSNPGDRPVDLTAQEAFIAFSGGGLPTEQECSATRVEKLLRELSIKRVVARHIRGTNRCTLDLLELCDGTTLHLGASTHGACVYRISGSAQYVQKELEGE